MLTLQVHMELFKFVMTHESYVTIELLKRRFPCNHSTAYKWMKQMEAAELVRRCPDEGKAVYRRNYHLRPVPSLEQRNQVHSTDHSLVPPTQENNRLEI